MMMDWLGRKHGEDELIAIGKLIDESVAQHLTDGNMLTYDLGGDAKCSEVGDAIAKILAEKMNLSIQ